MATVALKKRSHAPGKNLEGKAQTTRTQKEETTASGRSRKGGDGEKKND